jgi:diguanylate cyclase (GGDEF)-like protein
MLVIDRQTLRVLAANAAASALYRLTPGDLSALTALDRVARDQHPALLDDVRASARRAPRARRRLTGTSGAVDLPATGHDVLFGGRAARLLVVGDGNGGHGAVRKLEVAPAANHRHAVDDPLTGLPNRAGFHGCVQAAIDARPESPSFAVVVLGVDRFREVNDTLGHASGDDLLLELATRLRLAFRADDTVARLGGDQFAMLLQRPEGGPELVTDAVSRIAGALERPIVLQELPIVVEGGIGVAFHPDHGEDPAELLRAADEAMVRAKRDGTAYAVSSCGEHGASASHRLTVVGDLRRALERDELVVYYQPKVVLETGEPTSVEALVRWRHPVRGLLGPIDFVPLAEQTGLIRPLTRQVLRQALEQHARWRALGFQLAVAVNVSGRSLVDAELSGQVEGLLAAHAVPPPSLLLEVTESAIIRDPARAGAALARLALLGVRIALDDFGTGYSSLEHLGRLPLDQIKIDRSFVTTAAADPTNAAIVRSIVGLAHDLGLEVVAEGVETGAVYALLRSLGCDAAQGYFVSRPLTADQLVEFLARPRLPAPGLAA